MKILKCITCVLIAFGVTAVMAQDKAIRTNPPTQGQDDAAIALIRKNGEQLVAAFNAGNADDVTAKFLPKGELIDENGTIYQGEKEIKELMSAFFTRFPGTNLTINIESIRIVGPVAIEEGTRTMKAADGATRSQFRYLTVWGRAGDGWKLASHRDFADEPILTPGEYLQPLAWLVGEWINEGADGKVDISFRWSDDRNFLLGEFQMVGSAVPDRKSSQRIGWDANARKIRSWLFESDGGFADGYWTVFEDEIVAKYSSVNPDGQSASATITIHPLDKDRFSMAAADRIVGDNREPDFEINVVRKPPTAGK